MGSIKDFTIDGLFFDEEFKTGAGYGNFLSGEANPKSNCTGDLSGKIEGMTISSLVSGRTMDQSDFEIPAVSTVLDLVFKKAVDPHPAPTYVKYQKKNAYLGNGASAEIDSDGVVVRSASQCIERCHSDWSCDCVVFKSADGHCWKRRGCGTPELFDDDDFMDVYVILKSYFGTGAGPQCRRRDFPAVLACRFAEAYLLLQLVVPDSLLVLAFGPYYVLSFFFDF